VGGGREGLHLGPTWCAVCVCVSSSSPPPLSPLRCLVPRRSPATATALEGPHNLEIEMDRSQLPEHHSVRHRAEGMDSKHMWPIACWTTAMLWQRPLPFTRWAFFFKSRVEMLGEKESSTVCSECTLYYSRVYFWYQQFASQQQHLELPPPAI